MKIRVIEVGQRLSPKFLRKFRVLLNQIAESENADAEIDCILTTDRYVQKLNRKYLGKDKPTDVLSFPLGDVWEIYISVDTARKKLLNMDLTQSMKYSGMGFMAFYTSLVTTIMMPTWRRKWTKLRKNILPYGVNTGINCPSFSFFCIEW